MAIRMVITGRVQGVGFRFFVSQMGRDLGLSGWVRNLADGGVELLADGEPQAIAALRSAVRRGPAGANVAAVEESIANAGTLPTPFKIER